MASIQGDVAGRLRIACTTTAGKYVLPHLMANLLGRHPKVAMECLVVSRPEALQRLRDGDAHIAVASMREEQLELEYRAFLTDRIVLVVPPDHRWATRQEPIEVDDLRSERFVLREPTSGTYVALSEGLAWHDVEIGDLNALMTLGNAEAIRMTVQAGVGAAFVSLLVAREAVEAGKLVIVPVNGLELSKTLYLIRNPDRPATRAQSAFWALAFAPEGEPIRQDAVRTAGV
jgi:DNA-binding transcriptional LysR family regulator